MTVDTLGMTSGPTGAGATGRTGATEVAAGFVSDVYPAFFLQFWPAGPPRGHLIYLPPFGEEMNRCRAAVAEQARWFARQGLSCTVLDFYGTGESGGDLTDATLPIWRQNIEDLRVQLTQRWAAPVYLWGCRLGALIAVDYLQWHPGSSKRLLFWQPVPSGSNFVTQLLRQRAAALMQKGEQGETTAGMKARLAAGESIEVAGYRLGGELITAIDQLEMRFLPGGGDTEIFWMEHSADGSAALGARTARVIEQLQQTGTTIAVSTFGDEPIWQLHKRASCDDLLTKTRELVI